MKSEKHLSEVCYPLSGIQQGLLYHSLYANQSEMYISQAVVTLNEVVHVEFLRTTLIVVVSRHEILRSSFHLDEGQRYIQKIHAKVEPCMDFINCSSMSEAQANSKFEEFLLTDKKEAFDFTRVPLLRFTLVKFSEQHYRLVCTYHHILLCAPSALFIIKEIFGYYDSYLKQKEYQFVKLRPYAEYVAYLAKQKTLQAQKYWKQLLEGYDDPARLISNLDQRNSQTIQNRYHFQISEKLYADLKKLTYAEGITLNILLQAAWSLLLTAYTNSGDVVFGAVRSFPRPVVRNMSGLFINTLPVRIKINSEMTVNDLLGDLKKQHKNLKDYFYVPLAEIQQWSELPPTCNLFETVFDFKPRSLNDELKTLGENWLRRELKFTTDTNYSLLVEVYGENQNMYVILNYAVNLLDHEKITMIAQHFQNILRNISFDLTEKIRNISILSDNERKQILVDWNATEKCYPSNTFVYQLIEEQVTKNPNSLAVTFLQQNLKYNELNIKSNQLAWYLRRLGVLPNSIVAIYAERSLEMVVALLAVLKAGGCYLPLDPTTPQERIKYILNESKIMLLLTQKKLVPFLPSHHAQVILIDVENEKIAEQDSSNLPSVNKGDDLAYVIYTSGSTGTPKGVMNTHAGLYNRLMWMQEQYSLNIDDRVLQKTPYIFDVSVWEFFWPLMTGALLIVTKPKEHADVEYLIKLINEEKITVMHFIPSMLNAFLENPLVKTCVSLKKIFCSGETLSYFLQKKFFSYLNIELHNLYGPTEAAIDVTHWQCNDQYTDRIPIGKPIANTQIYILNKFMQPQPIGIAGELYIGGIGLAKGYIAQPHLTDEKFVVNPFDKLKSKILYKTGDMASWLPDGNIDFHGRMDYQIKLRGYRIELPEIEAVIAQYSSIRTCVVLQYRDDTVGTYLVAYVCSSSLHNSSDKLREYLIKRLPDYMIPARFIWLESIPLTQTGKIDRKALPPPEVIEKNTKKTPTTQTERKIAQIWSEVFNDEILNINANFFELGGHSLLAAKIISRVRESFQIEIYIKSLFENNTIKKFSYYIDTLKKEKNEKITLFPISRSGDIPLSTSQYNLWLVEQIDPNNQAYNMIGALLFEGSISIEFLKKIINEIILRHEILRTTISTKNLQPIQIVHEGVLAKTEVIDCIDASMKNWDELIKHHASHMGNFDFEKGPLFRTKILRFAENKIVLVIAMHHIICDGWSLKVFANDLSILWNAYQKSVAPELKKLEIQYVDYVFWEKRLLSSEEYQQHLSYWINKLADATFLLDLPLDKPRPIKLSYDGNKIIRFLPEKISTELFNFCNKENVTIYMFLLSVFYILLYRYTGQEDIILGTPVAGRQLTQFEPLIGLFVNTILLRISCSNDLSYGDFLNLVKDTFLEAFTHQYVSLDKLSTLLQPERVEGRMPLFQAVFMLQDDKDSNLKMDGITVSLYEFNSNKVKYELKLLINLVENGIQCIFEYMTDLFSQESIEIMSIQFESLLKQIIQSPAAKIGDLSLI